MEKILPWTLAFLVLLLTWLVFGFWYEWVDDVLMNNYLQGNFTGRPIHNFFLYHRGLSFLYAWFYRILPDFPWYGVFHYSFLYLATVNFLAVLWGLFRKLAGNPFICLFFVLSVCGFFWVENMYQFTFTRVGILLAGTSLISIIHNFHLGENENQIPIPPILLWIEFIVGFLIRPEAGMIVVLLGLFFFFFRSPEVLTRRNLKILIPIILFLTCWKSVEVISRGKDEKDFLGEWPRLFNALDGINLNTEFVNSIQKPEDKVRFFALQTWYFQDRQKMNEEFLQQISGENPFSFQTIINGKNNLKSEYLKSGNFGLNYHRPLNWRWKIFLFPLLLILISLANIVRSFSSPKPMRKFISIVGFPFLAMGMLFLIAFFVKMEDRIFTPVMILTLLCTLLLNFSVITFFRGKVFSLTIALILLSGCCFRFFGFKTICSQKHNEQLIKSNYLDFARQNFKGKIVFFDLYSMLMVPQTPLQVTNLNSSFLPITFGEYWSNSYQSHTEYCDSLCGRHDFPGFFDCLASKNDSVVFFLSDLRKNMMEDYFRILYGKTFCWESTSVTILNSEPVYSFLWFPMKFGFYTIKTK